MINSTLGAPFGGTILVDQGLDDKFLATQLQPERFEAAWPHVQAVVE